MTRRQILQAAALSLPAMRVRGPDTQRFGKRSSCGRSCLASKPLPSGTRILTFANSGRPLAAKSLRLKPSGPRLRPVAKQAVAALSCPRAYS